MWGYRLVALSRPSEALGRLRVVPQDPTTRSLRGSGWLCTFLHPAPQGQQTQPRLPEHMGARCLSSRTGGFHHLPLSVGLDALSPSPQSKCNLDPLHMQAQASGTPWLRVSRSGPGLSEYLGSPCPTPANGLVTRASTANLTGALLPRFQGLWAVQPLSPESHSVVPTPCSPQAT